MSVAERNNAHSLHTAYTQKKSLFTYKSYYGDARAGLPIRARGAACAKNRMGLIFWLLFHQGKSDRNRK